MENYALITHEGDLFQIRHQNGEVLFPTERAQSEWLVHPSVHCRNPVFTDIAVNRQRVTVMCHEVQLDGQSVLVYIGGSLEDNIYILNSYRNALLLGLPCLLGLTAVGGYLLSRRAMRPVDRMTKAALDIGIGNLSSRLPEPRAHDELWSLAVAWNQLLDRLEGAVSRLSRFSADASHDLRTSITVILATAQLSLHRRRTEQEYRENLERIVTECRTASTLLDALLSLARSDNFAYEVSCRHINAGELAVAVCRRIEDLAECSGILLDWRLPNEDSFIFGDELLLQRLLGILLDNAVKYTPKGGEILVEVSCTECEVIVSVQDTGTGMSNDLRQHIFDRFYRGIFANVKSMLEMVWGWLSPNGSPRHIVPNSLWTAYRRVVPNFRSAFPPPLLRNRHRPDSVRNAARPRSGLTKSAANAAASPLLFTVLPDLRRQNLKKI